MRSDGRQNDQLRPVKIQTHINIHAEGSCILEMGNTRVHCTASVSEDVPTWRKQSGKGWITAEYRMLPRSTHTRNNREGNTDKKGRTAEIERLIGRALRAAIDLDRLGPRIITIDCDVLQADGGTRCASINGGWIALTLALHKLVEAGKLPEMPLKHIVSAISVGIVEGEAVADLPYIEDAAAQVDLNLVMTQSGQVVEVQGTAEGEPYPLPDLMRLIALGTQATQQLATHQKNAVAHLPLPVGI